MKIVFLDAKTIGDDIDLSGFDALGEVTRYDFTTPEEAPERVKDADVLIINKVPVNEQTIHTAAHLKLVCVTATGTNNLDKDYLASRGIAWRNVAGYSTETVTQHTFAMLFYLLEKLRYYDDYVKNGNYINDTCFTHFSEHFSELNGKTWGIIGLGAIGRRVAQIAEAFGAHVIYYSASGQPAQNGYTQVDLDTLLTTSDIISVEQDLYDALITDEIAAAGLDVLCQEPMSEQNPLFQIKDSRKLLITPHIAWAGIEARIRLMDIILNQIKDFFEL